MTESPQSKWRWYCTGLIDALDGRVSCQDLLIAAEMPADVVACYMEGRTMGVRLERDARIEPDLFEGL